MKSTAIFLPALALMLWTLLVLVQVPIRRFTAYFRKRVGPLDFQCGESSNVPADVALPNRIFMNLLEVPVLFYALAFIAFSTNQVNPVSVGLAWLYVALRVVHSLIYFHLQPRRASLRGVRHQQSRRAGHDRLSWQGVALERSGIRNEELL